MGRIKAGFLAAALAFGLCALSKAQEKIDFNQRYRFPVGLSVGYESLIPLGSAPSAMSNMSVTGTITVPLPGTRPWPNRSRW